MRTFDRHPRLRWAVPAATAAVLIGGAAISPSVTAESGVEPRTAAELLVDLQQPTTQSLSGTVVTRTDLGLPELPTGVAAGGELGLASGERTVRVWIADEQHQRLALLGRASETTVIRNGDQVWVWDSRDATADSYDLSDHDGDDAHGPSAGPLVEDAPSTPQEAADRVLAAISPTTEVTTSAPVRVAGRDGHDLVLTPRDPDTLVGHVSLVIDAETHVPLRVRVYAAGHSDPAVEVGFTDITFGTPEAELFAFTPPPGATVTEHAASSLEPSALPEGTGPPIVVGEGWSTIVIADIGDDLPGLAGASTKPPGDDDGGGRIAADEVRTALALVETLPQESGEWGTGRVLRGTLFSAILTSDGRLAIGAVRPEGLEAALAAR